MMTTSNNSKKSRVKFSGSWLELDDFAQKHPGGQVFIQLMEGGDVTDIFRAYHPHLSDSHIRGKLRKVKDENINDDERSERKEKECQNVANNVTRLHAKAFRELQKEVLAALGGFHQTKGTNAYFLKVFVLTMLYIGSESMQWIYGFNLYRGNIHGAAAALIGMNIMHEANHGAASLNAKINYILGVVSAEMIGKSAIYWTFAHNFWHHRHTNSEDDPDARTSPVLRAHPTDAPRLINKFQHVYVWPLFAVQQFFQIFIAEPIYLTTEKKQNDMVQGDTEHTVSNKTDCLADVLPPLPDTIKNDRIASLFMRFLFYLRFMILPIVYAPEWNTVLCIGTSILVASMLLGPLFIVAHNFLGVKFHSNATDDERISFLASQVETSCNWGGWLGIQLTGGLSCKYLFNTFSVSLLFYI